MSAQDTEGENPTGPAGDYNGEVTTAGSYDAYTQNAKRSITDLTVPGSAGTYPLAFTRTYNSAGFATTTDAKVFGDGGNWRHSYMWHLSPTEVSGPTVTAFTLAYPDGAGIVFRPNRATTPAGESSTYWRGPIGTQDRLEVPDSNLGDAKPLYLHLSDGGVVTFTYLQNSTNSQGTGDLQATAITDPYGATTALAYGTNGLLSQVTEPGGRWLKFVYTTYSERTPYQDAYGNYYIYWTLLTQVQAGNGSTVRQTVSYSYVTYGTDDRVSGQPEQKEYTYTTPYYVLGSVNYDMEASTSGSGDVQATYQYTQASASVPVLLSAHDPHYAGAMVDIAYSYSSVAGGGVSGEGNYNASSQTNGPAVSQVAVSSNTTLVETRGDKDASGNAITRTFTYGQPNNTTNNSSLWYNPENHTWENTDGSETASAKAAQLTACTDWQGNTTSLVFYGSGSANGQGNLWTVTNALGYVASYGHEPITGKVASVRLPDGRIRAWNYLSKDLSDPKSGPSVQPYYLYSTVDERNQTTIYHRYPNTGLVSETDYPDGSKESFSYTGFTVNGNNYYKIGYHKSTLGAQTYYNYGTNSASGNADLLLSVIRYYQDANGTAHSETTSFKYDALDRLISSQDPGGVVTQFSYNGRHQLTQTLHASDGTHVDRTYDDLGNCVSVSDELQHVTTTAYDSYRRVTSVTVPVNDGTTTSRITSFVYDPRDQNSNQLALATTHTRAQWSVSWSQSGKGLMHVFTSNGWPTYELRSVLVSGSSSPGSSAVSVSQGAGFDYTVVPSSDYSAIGQVLTSVDANGGATNYTYDNCGRKTSATDPIGHQTTWTYYGPNQPSSSTNYAGWLESVTTPGPDLNNYPTVITTYNGYDPMGRVTSTQDPSRHTFTSAYDLGGDLTSQSDGDQASGQHVISYGFDQLGRKNWINDAASTGVKESWTYNPTGTVNTYTNYAGTVCTYTYDGRNRCTGDSWNDSVTSPTGYQYDSASRVTAVNNWHANVGYTYDDSGAARTEVQQHYDANGALTTHYTHDADGNVTVIQDPDGFGPCYAYDAQQRCTGVYAGNTTFSTYSYSGDWLVERAMYNNVFTAYGYQNNGRCNDVWHRTTDAQGNYKNISRHAYGYAPDGQITWFDREADGGSSGSSLENGRGDMYWYAPDGSLTNAARDVAATGGWPARFDETHDGEAPCSSSSVSYASGVADSYGSYYNYDAAGNRSNVAQYNPSQQIGYSVQGNNEYNGSSYDANFNTTNSAVGWTYTYDAENHLTGASGPGGRSPSFEYDGLGRLIVQNANGVTMHFYYAGNQRVEERDASNNILENYMFDAPGSDSILMRQGQYGTVWYQYDLMGNTSHLTNNAGQVVEQYLYDCYGTPSVYNAAGTPLAGTTVDNRYLFKGADAYEWIAPMGTYYARARFYLPFHGRFLQPDPIGQKGGLNIYTYCHNDPVNKSDPSGLFFSISAGTSVTLSPDMASIMSSTGSISDNYSSNGLIATAMPSSTAGFLSALGGQLSSGLTVYMGQEGEDTREEAAETGSYRTIEEQEEAEKEEEEYGHRLDHIHNKPYTLLEIIESWFGKGRVVEDENIEQAIQNQNAAKSGETSATKAGRQAHKDWNPGEGFEKEVTLPSGKRADAVNLETKEVKELKPNNPRAVKRGENQVERYRQELQEEHGGNWKSKVETYN